MIVRCYSACFMLAVAAAGGCTTNDSSLPLRPPLAHAIWNPELRFSEVEVRSRTWIEAGSVLKLLGYSVTRVMGRPDLVIAKYGPPATGEVRCIDFYESRPTVPDQEALLILIAHDRRAGRVTSLEVVSGNGKATVHITREFLQTETQKRVRMTYVLEYMDDHRMTATTSETESVISDHE